MGKKLTAGIVLSVLIMIGLPLLTELFIAKMLPFPESAVSVSAKTASLPSSAKVNTIRPAADTTSPVQKSLPMQSRSALPILPITTAAVI